jgi:hypothetical protein
LGSVRVGDSRGEARGEWPMQRVDWDLSAGEEGQRKTASNNKHRPFFSLSDEKSIASPSQNFDSSRVGCNGGYGKRETTMYSYACEEVLLENSRKRED